MLFHLRAHLTHVSKILAEAAVVVAVLPTIGLTLEIVVTRSAVLVAGGLAAVRDDFLYPPLLGLCGDIYRLVAVAARVVDARGDVIALGLQHIGQVELKGGLIAAHDEEVGIALRVNPNEGADAIAVFIIEVEAPFSLDLVVDTRLLYLKARGIDENVELVLFALKPRSLLR